MIEANISYIDDIFENSDTIWYLLFLLLFLLL